VAPPRRTLATSGTTPLPAAFRDVFNCYASSRSGEEARAGARYQQCDRIAARGGTGDDVPDPRRAPRKTTKGDCSSASSLPPSRMARHGQVGNYGNGHAAEYAGGDGGGGGGGGGGSEQRVEGGVEGGSRAKYAKRRGRATAAGAFARPPARPPPPSPALFASARSYCYKKITSLHP